ncbi:MAG: aminopeptidase P family N-terminal domain-containing protein, partial [Hyphomicrobiaceae bacterium]
MASRWELIDVALPEYGLPHKRPTLDQSIYQARIARLSERTEQSGLDCVLVYADREHFANLAYLTGFDPRFEEALLILVPGSRPLLITGPENQSYADVSPIEMERVVYPPFGLLGQDRSKTPDLAELLGDAGLRRGWQVGVAGWKYFGDNECADPATWLETPAYIIDALRVLVGDGGVVNAGRIFMDSSDGLRATNEVDQLAQFEHAACHASEAVKRALTGLRPGLSEFEIAALMQLESLPLSCHPMCSSGSRTKLGLAS